MGARGPERGRECTSQLVLVPLQIMLMITAAARHMSAPTARNPPNRAVKNAVPSRRSRPAVHDSADRHDRRDPEHDPDDGEPGRHERHLEGVAEEDRVGEEREPAEQRDDEERRARG